MTDLAHMLYAGDEIAQALNAEPEGFDAGFAVALTGEESAELRDQADDLANRRHLLRWLLLVEDEGAGPFRFGEEQIGRPLRVDASQANQTGEAPGNDQIDRQRQFQLALAAQLQGLDPAAVLEYMEQGFDLPAAAIPVDQFDGRLKTGNFTIGQQAPFDRLAAGGRFDFGGDQTGHADVAAVRVRSGKVDRLASQLLAHNPFRLPVPRCQGEFDLAERRFGKSCRPQFAALRQTAVVLGANQPVCWRPQHLGAVHQADHVRFAVGHIDQPRLWHRRRGFGDPLVAFDPARALADARPASVGRFRLSRPHPGVDHPERCAFRRDRIGRMQIHAALGFIRERPESFDLLAVEVQFGGVLKAQHDWVLRHAPLAAIHVWLQDRSPGQPTLASAGLVEEAVSRQRLRPIPAGARYARRRLLGKARVASLISLSFRRPSPSSAPPNSSPAQFAIARSP